MAILIGILNSLLVLLSLFLICLVLIQRGKGGGLAGAFGGVGGSSAFGTKAGDVFTRVTIIVAAVWFSLTLILNIVSNRRSTSAWGDEPSRTATKQLPDHALARGRPRQVDLAVDEAPDRSAPHDLPHGARERAGHPERAPALLHAGREDPLTTPIGADSPTTRVPDETRVAAWPPSPDAPRLPATILDFQARCPCS